MAKMTVGPGGIEIIQGAISKPVKKDGHSHGNYVITTHRTAPTESEDCQRFWVRNRNAYKRTGALSTKEIAARTRFATVKAAVYERAYDLTTIAADQAAFEAQKNTAGGKKTFNAYLWKVCGQAYDAEHPRN